MKRIALIVGHSQSASGAINYKGESEYSFNSRIADRVQDICQRHYESSLDVKVFKRHGGPYRVLAPEISLYKPDATFELHFNAAEGRASGVEMLVYERGPKSLENAMIADLFTDRFSNEYGIHERHTVRLGDDSVVDGVKYMSEGRGAHNLKTMHFDCNVPFAFLFEPVFGNFETGEARAIFENEDRYVAFLVSAFGEMKELI